MKTELIVPLDFGDSDEADEIVEALGDLPIIYKVGFELFTSAGPGYVQTMVENGKRVFLDLKFHDIPNTVSRAVAQAEELGVEFFTFHIAGGRRMAQSALSLDPRPKALGVTVLTSFNQENWSEVMDSRESIADSVDRLVEKAIEWGSDGIVCSAHELSRVRARHPDLYTVVPGIRLEGDDSGDQSRVMTPEDASKVGASAIVMGRSITRAKKPRMVAEGVLAVIK